MAFDEERRALVASTVRQRRDAIFDACVGIVGCAGSVAHAFAPWAILFEILHVEWTPYAYAAASAVFGIWNAVEGIHFHRLLARIA